MEVLNRVSPPMPSTHGPVEEKVLNLSNRGIQTLEPDHLNEWSGEEVLDISNNNVAIFPIS